MSLPSRSTLYEAIERKDASFDGVFFVAVKTTRIFCRPVCPARTPKRENVEFFATAEEALLAGYRPCKRCRPMDRRACPPKWIHPILDAIESNPRERITDSDIRALGVAPERVRRWFKSNHGMTFQGFHRALRMGAALKTIRSGGDAVDAAIDSGYDSDSGFRDAFERILGEPPSHARNIKAMAALRIETPLGPMLAVANDDALCLLEFVDRKMLPTQIQRLRNIFGCAVVPGSNQHLSSIKKELGEYFAGRLTQFSTNFELRGSPFQIAVWKTLREIPHGSTRSYSEIAKAIGFPNGARAVGRANGDNRLAIIVPCHRVIRADGSLCGYGGGLWRKKRLLELERGVRTLV